MPAALQRATLLVNHVLSAEPAAMQRLVPHSGKRLRVELTQWPALLPAPPVAHFQVTPAGLLDWCGDDSPAPADTAAALTLRIAAANPALLMVRLAAGERPDVAVQGDAQLANDINWLVDNLRWDIESDLARVIGTASAHQLAALGAALAAGLRRWAQPAATP